MAAGEGGGNSRRTCVGPPAGPISTPRAFTPCNTIPTSSMAAPTRYGFASLPSTERTAIPSPAAVRGATTPMSLKRLVASGTRAAATGTASTGSAPNSRVSGPFGEPICATATASTGARKGVPPSLVPQKTALAATAPQTKNANKRAVIRRLSFKASCHHRGAPSPSATFLLAFTKARSIAIP